MAKIKSRNHISGNKIEISVPQKDIALAIILTILFGPLGLLYVDVKIAFLMFIVTFIISLFTYGFGFLFTWPICVILAYYSVKKYNAQKIEEQI